MLPLTLSFSNSNTGGVSFRQSPKNTSHGEWKCNEQLLNVQSTTSNLECFKHKIPFILSCLYAQFRFLPTEPPQCNLSSLTTHQMQTQLRTLQRPKLKPPMTNFVVESNCHSRKSIKVCKEKLKLHVDLLMSSFFTQQT